MKQNLFKILNGYEDADWHIFFKLKDGTITRADNAALVKEHILVMTALMLAV